MIAAVILAAGRGERMGAKRDKAFLPLGSRPVVAHSLFAFEACAEIGAIVLVVRPDLAEAAREICRQSGLSKLHRIVMGGDRRQDSVCAGLDALPPDADFVAIHDAARPLVSPALIAATVASARAYGSGIAAHKVTDTLKAADADGFATATVDRASLWAVATPQTFRTELIRRAYDAVAARGDDVTDDAGALERLGERAHLVNWPAPNIKITFAEDLETAEALIGAGRRP